jgi:hypothetical protein
MNLTVSQLLGIVGRLDDNPGFDTSRERFRRFLAERITDAESARAVIAECRQVGGEQHGRALHDAVVQTGKLLGFETSYGPYEHDAAAAIVGGEWLSRRRLRVLLMVCGALTDTSHLESLAQVVANTNDSQDHPGPTCVGLCVVTPLCAAKARIEDSFRSHAHAAIRLISLEGILHLTELTGAERLTREDTLRLLNPPATLDSLIEVLDRRATTTAAAVLPVRQLPVPEESPGNRCWVAAIRLPQHMASAPFVDSVIVKRRLLAVNPGAQVRGTIRMGDAVCVSIADAGFVAHARVDGLVTDGSTLIRDAQRFAQVLKLADVTVYDAPLLPTPDLVRRLDLGLNGDADAIISPISRQDFELVVRAATPARN